MNKRLTTQGKKINERDRQLVIGVYLGCLNYNLTARLTGIATNSVKNIVKKERQKDPKNFAKLCTKLQKKNNELLERALEITQDEQFIRASRCYIANPYKLNQYMNLQDRQLISRNKLLYDAKIKALTYEAMRIERALKLRDLKALTNLLKEAKKDTSLYEPIDLEFLETPAFYGMNNRTKYLSSESKENYIRKIETYLKEKGYDLTNVDLHDFIADKKEAFNYYYF